jgi:glycosyltransferase involved in cell wall biosynthesis
VRVAVGILCHNQIEHDRRGLFAETLESVRIANPDHLIVADNGSTDGTADLIADMPDGVAWQGPISTCGYGMNKLAATLIDWYAPDIVVLSNDDIVWQTDAFEVLRDVWESAPDDLAIVSGLLEPTFSLPNQEPWNLPTETLKADGHLLLVRNSVPGGAWSFPAKHHGLIFPVFGKKGTDDVPACRKVRKLGYRVAALELARNAGIEKSTWNNGSYQRFIVQPVEDVKAEWGL